MSSRRAGPRERDVAAEPADGGGDGPPGWQPIAAAMVVAALVTLDVCVGGPLRHADHLVQRAAASGRDGSLRTVCRGLAQVGQRHVLVDVIVAVIAVAAVRVRSWRPVVPAVTACAVALALTAVVKLAVGRSAPSTGRDVLFGAGREFPSGHAVNAVVAWGVVLEMVVLIVPVFIRLLPPLRRRLLVAVLALLAGGGMVGAGYHWFTDALAGWAVGAVVYLSFLRAWAAIAPRTDVSVVSGTDQPALAGSR